MDEFLVLATGREGVREGGAVRYSEEAALTVFAGMACRGGRSLLVDGRRYLSEPESAPRGP
jgi:hypothetical protein